MSKDVIEKTFQTKFITKWLFDVEILWEWKLRWWRNEKLVCEQPERWIHADGSKLSFKDSLKIVFQIGHIANRYKSFTFAENIKRWVVSFNYEEQIKFLNENKI
jgi:hypothetical protein